MQSWKCPQVKDATKNQEFQKKVFRDIPRNYAAGFEAGVWERSGKHPPERIQYPVDKP